MPNYFVTLSYCTDVESDSKEDAIEQAFYEMCKEKPKNLLDEFFEYDEEDED